MKFQEHAVADAAARVFSVYVGAADLAFVENERQFRGFAQMMMERLSSMIAAYYFKRYKTAFDEFLSSPEIKDLVAQKLADRLEVSMRN